MWERLWKVWCDVGKSVHWFGGQNLQACVSRVIHQPDCSSRLLSCAEKKCGNYSTLVMSWYRDFATIQCHDIANIHSTIHHDTPRYRPSMKQQIIWYHRQCVCVCVCVVFNNSRKKISSRCVLIIKHVRMTLDKCLSNVYPSPNLTFSHNTKTEQHPCKKDSWPQIDGSITAMRKHGVVVNIHW